MGLSIAPSADAAYMLTPMVGGLSVVTLEYGQTFEMQVMLSSDAGDAHNSSLFRLLFTEAGIEYLGYSWGSPYEDKTFFDFSAPLWTALPAVIDPDLVPGGASVSDISLSNVVPNGSFGEGQLVTLSLRIPSDWSGPSTVFVVPLPDTFANGFDEIETEAGTALTLNLIVPSPGAVGLLVAAAGVGAVRRRRAR
ncbi:MAG: hypothetical protein ACTS3F_04890 [Phycisphaerales bacterium]